MKKKKRIFIIIAILIIICAIIATIVVKNVVNNNEAILKMAETTVEKRKLWNDFLNENPYLSQIETISEFVLDADLIKLAITSDNVETERIVTEEIQKNPSLTLGDGYKKSKNNINNYVKNLFGETNIEYNFVDTYAKKDNYLLIGEDYVYYTKLELPEKIYIAVKNKEKKEKYEVQIYEYDVTDENKEDLMSMLETGNINEKIEITSRYILTGQIENENIKIDTKTSLQK